MPRPRKPARAFRSHWKPPFTEEELWLAGPSFEWEPEDLVALDHNPRMKALFLAEQKAWRDAGRPPLPDWTRFMATVDGVKLTGRLMRECGYAA
jgi:hypothetical protein